jgi:hypothetical protein
MGLEDLRELTPHEVEFCSSWINGFSAVCSVPRQEHFQALSLLTGAPANAIEQWCGATLRHGLSSAVPNPNTTYGNNNTQITFKYENMPPVTGSHAVSEILIADKPKDAGNHKVETNGYSSVRT